jgi:NAD(P)-dependent dehydrogenase (short-subunit alcohol dehydrogenase family)
VTSAWLADGRSGQISMVNVASVAGGLKGVAPAWCSASKAVVAGYTRYLAVALGPRIRANAVAPGVVETLIASDLGDKIRAQCLCNGLLSRRRAPKSSFSCSRGHRPMSTASSCRSMAAGRSCNRHELWQRRQIRRESTYQGDSKMQSKITTGAQERGGGYAIGPSR